MKSKYIIALCLLFVLVTEMAFVVKVKRDSSNQPVTKAIEMPIKKATSVIQVHVKSSNSIAVSSIN